MADIELTLHPNVNGVIDTDTNIYPKVKTSCILDEDTVLQHKLTAGNGINIDSDNVITAVYHNNAALKQFILDFIYPIGSVYVSVSDQNPNIKFGGNWERITDTILYAGKFGIHETEGDLRPGDSGGSNDAITLAHAHYYTPTGNSNPPLGNLTASFSINNSDTDDGGDHRLVRKDTDNVSLSTVSAVNDHHPETDIDSGHATKVTFDLNHSHPFTGLRTLTETTGDGISSESGVGKNLPKYIAVYMWKRVG